VLLHLGLASGPSGDELGLAVLDLDLQGADLGVLDDARVL